MPCKNNITNIMSLVQVRFQFRTCSHVITMKIVHFFFVTLHILQLKTVLLVQCSHEWERMSLYGMETTLLFNNQYSPLGRSVWTLHMASPYGQSVWHDVAKAGLIDRKNIQSRRRKQFNCTQQDKHHICIVGLKYSPTMFHLPLNLR